MIQVSFARKGRLWLATAEANGINASASAKDAQAAMVAAIRELLRRVN